MASQTFANESGNQETKRFGLGKQEHRMFFFCCFPIFMIQVPIPVFMAS
jgi:hypothetical protein